MAPKNSFQRTHSPNGRRRQLGLPSLAKYIQQETRTKSKAATSNNSIKMSPLTDLSDLSLALNNNYFQMNSSASTNNMDSAIKDKEVRFNTKVSVVEIPPEQHNTARVSFSDEVIDIDTVEFKTPSPSPTPPRKQVRFGCLKKKGFAHFSHTPIYKIKNFDALGPLLKPKKRVRFGCLKCESPPSSPSTPPGVWDLVADEAATFKRSSKGMGYDDDDEDGMLYQTNNHEDMVNE